MKNKKIIKVIIVDDHEVILRAIPFLIEDENKIKVVGTAHNGKTAVKTIKELHPHVVLLDIQLPEINGFDVMNKIRRTNKKIKFIIFTALHTKEVFDLAHAHKADGYIIKTASPDVIKEAIYSVIENLPYFHYHSTKPLAPILENLFSKLSGKEVEILKLLLQGYDSHEIAEQLHRNERTIRKHREHIREKLDVKTDVDLGLLAGKTGYWAPH